MVERRLRSRSVKKTKKKTPGGETRAYYKSEKPSKHKCGRCGKLLAGTPNEVPSKIKKLSKSEKKPSRPYGGNLCSNCLERLLRYQTRFEVKHGYKEYSELPLKRDLTLEKYLPRGWFKELSKE